MSESSFGSVAPKSRSINVGANLLGEWVEEQSRMRRELGLYAGVFGAALLAALIGAPILFRTTGHLRHEAATVRGRRADLDAALAITDAARKAAQPALQVEAMREKTQVSFDRLTDELDGILKAGSARTAFTNLHADVQAGEIHLLVRAEAEDDAAADAFAQAAAEEGSTVDAITNSRPSALLGPQGISFLYEKRRPVAR